MLIYGNGSLFALKKGKRLLFKINNNNKNRSIYVFGSV